MPEGSVHIKESHPPWEWCKIFCFCLFKVCSCDVCMKIVWEIFHGNLKNHKTMATGDLFVVNVIVSDVTESDVYNGV